MSLADKLYQIDQLQQAIKDHGQLPEDVLKKINYKFRLEWNYNSNSMEGNSLTRAETRSVMINNITVEGKPLRDVLEMRQHDNVITSILKMGQGELNISEKRIKEIHSSILSESDPEKLKQAGQWKKEPNHLINYRNERFDFIAPAEVPGKIHELVNWLNAQKEKIERREKAAMHPVLLAFEFHLRYLTIHPFHDGNGRTARILTNIILISYSYPPIYIKLDEKTSYYQYLADIQGYGGGPDLLYEFMADLLMRSQKIVLDVVQGIDIEEPDDLDKKIFILNQEMESLRWEEGVQTQMNENVFLTIYKTWLKNLLNTTNSIANKFNSLFKTNHHRIVIQMERGFPAKFLYEEEKQMIETFLSLANSTWQGSNTEHISIIFEANYEQSIKGGPNAFNCNYNLEVKFNKASYDVNVDTPAIENSPKLIFYICQDRVLNKPLSKNEVDAVTKQFGETIFRHIEYHIKKLDLE